MLVAESAVGKGTTFTLSLPNARSTDLSLSDRRFDYAGGFDHVLMELSDALPSRAFLQNTWIEGAARMAKKVLVGMSGGVDSAACVLPGAKAGLCCFRRHTAAHHYKDRPGTCGSADDIEEAARVAAQMGISHRVLDLCDLFRREVMGHFVSEYCAGRTPNPCLDCNRELKFGAMLDWALDHGFDYVSTGHYARVGFDAASGRHLLLRGVDAHKDQSYVLYQMTQRQLAHLLLPVGEYSKPEIRALAADFGLENAQKPDSQDICFVPDGDYVRFLREFGGVTPSRATSSIRAAASSVVTADWSPTPPVSARVSA